MIGPLPPALYLDHASVIVPDLPAAVEHLDVRLGLRATVSAGDPTRHSRVYLDRSYLEVAAPGHALRWQAANFFLRFDDPRGLRAHLDSSGLSSRFSVYEGVDGRWDDVEIEAGSVPLPILVRRTHPPEVSRCWPPPLTEPHPCGARALAAVQILVTDWHTAIAAYRRLLGLGDRTLLEGFAGSGRRRVCLPLASGELVLTEAEVEGIGALILGVASLAETVATLGRDVKWTVADPVAWLDPAAAFGLRIGLVETGSGCSNQS